MIRSAFNKHPSIPVLKKLISSRNLTRTFCLRSTNSLFLKFKRSKWDICLLKNINYQDSLWNQKRLFCDSLPPHTKVLLPALSPTMEVGTIISWEKNEGDALNEGDVLAEIETDKTTMGFETPEEGYLARILISAGTKDIPVGKLLCILVEDKSSIEAFKNYKPPENVTDSTKPSNKIHDASKPIPIEQIPSEPTPVTTSKTTEEISNRVYVSPMAKRLAEQRNIRLKGKGTGVFNSITSQDLNSLVSVQSFAEPSATKPESISAATMTYIDIPLSNMRSVIAKRLLQSKNTIPHYYLNVEINVDNLMHLRTRFNKMLEADGNKLSLNDFIIKASSIACLKVPEVNSAWQETFIRQYNNVDISVAVSTDRGLITPIIFRANQKGILSISQEMKALARKARENKLQPTEFQGGTFSISNLGMFGINTFTAIINPPQSCILAVGAIQTRLNLDSNSEQGIKETKLLSATLSCDHRVVDGAVGAKWMQHFRSLLENPENMLL